MAGLRGMAWAAHSRPLPAVQESLEHHLTQSLSIEAETLAACGCTAPVAGDDPSMTDVPVFPPLEPFQTGSLRVEDGNQIYWETSGNPAGKPVIYLHGGPGSGVGTGYRRHFDPAAHFIVTFDQRGCGRSRPWASHAPQRLATNTTQAIIADMEALRQHLGVARWMITGVSWGTALGLAYAQAHPDRVTEMVLALIHIPSAEVVDWTTEQLRRVFPLEWEALATAVPRRAGSGSSMRVMKASHTRTPQCAGRQRRHGAAGRMRICPSIHAPPPRSAGRVRSIS